MENVYLVIASRGSYDDYISYVEKVFAKKEDAEKYAKEFDESHIYESTFEDDVWFDICDLFDEYENAHEEMFTNHCDRNDKEAWEKRNEEIDNLMNEQYLKIAHEIGLTSVTMDDIIKQVNYETHKWVDWHSSNVKEMKVY